MANLIDLSDLVSDIGAPMLTMYFSCQASRRPRVGGAGEPRTPGSWRGPGPGLASPRPGSGATVSQVILQI